VGNKPATLLLEEDEEAPAPAPAPLLEVSVAELLLAAFDDADAGTSPLDLLIKS